MHKLVPLVSRRLYDTNDIIVQEGEVGNYFYLIESGTVEVFKNTGRAEIIIGYIKKDGIFGEMALVDGDRRSASVRAIEPTVCRVFPREYFQYRLGRSDKLIRALMRIFTAHIRSLTQLQAEVGAGEVQRPTLAMSKDDFSEG